MERELIHNHHEWVRKKKGSRHNQGTGYSVQSLIFLKLF